MTSRLLEPFELGTLSLRNRLVFAPITTRYATERGEVTERLKAHYEARAKGGVGLIVVEATYVEPRGQAFPNQVSVSSDDLIPGLKELVDVIKRHGCASSIQLHHGGRMAKSALTGSQPVGPSAIAHPRGELPRELMIEEIPAIVQSFADAARRAYEAGFDGIELHGAHAYLIDAFISGASNKRIDQYGGLIENRTRLLVEITTAVRKATAADYPVWVRMNAREYGVEGGTTLSEGLAVAKIAEEAGCDAIHASSFGPATPTNRTTATFRPAVIGHLAAAMKGEVSIPVMAVGRITPNAGEELLERGEADLIALGKALLADPDIPNKLAAGMEREIVPCIVCMYCRDTLYMNDVPGIRCQVNPLLGRDHEPVALPATAAKRVLVVGGGPAGMSAALTAARRGHDVTLWEQGPNLGGQLLPAAVPPHKDRIGYFTRYLTDNLGRARVSVETNKNATKEGILEGSPDAVVLAVGPVPAVPQVPGIETASAVEATDMLANRVKAGKRVVVIGGELVGCEAAEYLAEQGCAVTVTRRGNEMATSIGPSLRQFFLERLQRKGVTLMPGVHYVEARPGSLVVKTPEGNTRVLEADTLVLATGSVANTSLADELAGQIGEVHVVGDCREPRAIVDAVREGYEAGSKL